jgi:tripartite-type tricarboxylate transporter receptor subunit TctC
MTTRFLFHKLSAALLAMAAALATVAPLHAQAQAQAQPYPAKPIRIVVPFPPGGAQDTLARTLAEGLAVRLAQVVLVENRPGAAGNIGADVVAKSPPDGYTLGVLSGVHTANAAFYRKTPFDLEKDFVPVRALGDSAVLVVAGNHTPYRTLAEFLAYVKSHPGKVMFGSTTSLTMDLLNVQTGAEVTMVPYKGLGEALQDVMGGRLDLAAGPSPQLVPLIRDGKIRALGLASVKRMPELPGVATFAEAVPGYDAGMWYGVFAPAGTPPAVVQRLNRDIQNVMDSKELQAKLQLLGIDTTFGVASAAQVRERMQAEIARWRRVAAKTGNYVN